MKNQKAVIMGAAGRDFHNFNVYFKNNHQYEIVAFTAAQIPDIDGRIYPPELSGPLYPKGIPIRPEGDLKDIIENQGVEKVFFSYSDVPHLHVMHKASQVIAWGADFSLLGANSTMLKSKKPVISICAVRTGCGKSQTTRRVVRLLKGMGKKVVSVRHPMPYGNLVKQKVQCFASAGDLKKQKCTIEEIEEYEPHIAMGSVIYAGVDYEAILREAEKEADIIVWDGGNNDIPFFKSDLEIVVVDPHRAGHELKYYPGETNLLRAHVIIVNKVDTADQKGLEMLLHNIFTHNPGAVTIQARSPIFVTHPEKIRDKKVLVVEDGPTLTHGEMKFGAGIIAARKYRAREIIDPRPYVTGTLTGTYKKYPYIGTLLPAMGYGVKQMKDLEQVINKTPCDLVVIGTPIDLSKYIHIKKDHVRVTYELEEKGKPNLESVLEPFVQAHTLMPCAT